MTDANESAWRARVEKTIGASYETLVAQSADGIGIAPLYERRREAFSGGWRGRPAWAVAQRVDHPETEAANGLARAELEGGADALTLVFAGSPFSRGFGLAADADLDQVLDGIELDFIDLRLDAGPDTLAAAKTLGALVAGRTLTSASLRIDLGYDPIGIAARSDGRPDLGDIPELLAVADKAGLGGRPLLADGRVWHEAGAGEALELAAVLATGVAYLRALETAGLTLDAAREKIAVLLAVDADVLLGLAKVRAMRRLWARIEAASELAPQPLRLHAETAWRMMTRRDPWTNVMRATAATFAAGLGGADAVTVLPMTLPLGLPDEPARRLARNVQRVLIDESNLAMVDDPAAGSGGFEALTDGLCRTAWSLFQAIEAEGGIVASLDSGALPARLADAAKQRRGAVASLAHGIVGTSRYPSLTAPIPGVLDVAPRAGLIADGALPGQRDAVPFEALRDRAEARAEPPDVFLATLGAPAAFGPRATWARNFLAAGGLAAVPATSEQDVAALAAAFAASSSAVACLCGTDKAYAADGPALVEALRKRGARRVLVAGRSGDGVLDGIDAFIHDGCDALEVLSATLDVVDARPPKRATPEG